MTRSVRVGILAVAGLFVACRARERAGATASRSMPDASFALVEPDAAACPDAVRALRQRELQEIVARDQAERVDAIRFTKDEWLRLQAADRERRARVGAIYAEGCFATSADFAAAALVYQHGEVPEDYLTAFRWARRAVELGDTTKKELMALTIDRYLMHTGHRQLFGSQTGRKDGVECWCMLPVEPSFPDEMRVEYTGRSLASRYASLDESNAGHECPARECAPPLSPSPRGTVPGLW
jgi:hypothetical protein